MMRTGCDGHDSDQGRAAWYGQNIYRCSMCIERSITQLSPIIDAPAFDTSAGHQGTGMIKSSRNRADANERRAAWRSQYIYWGSALSCCTVAQLACIIPAPALDVAIHCYGTGIA